MAISYINVDIVRRSRGDNSLEAAAYRSRSALFDDNIGKTFSYENLGNAKKDLIHSNILLPDTAYSGEYNSENHPLRIRENLWNAVEDVENGHNRSADAQLAIDLTIALPKELSMEMNIKLAEQFIKENYVDKHNVIADINIHDEGDGNPHAHVMITFRDIQGVEFSKKKIRTITPQLYKVNGKEVVRQDQIVTKYTNFQNKFFKENNIELVVDQKGIISGIHMSRNGYHGGFNKDDLAENKRIAQSNADLVSSDHDAIIDTLAYRQTTFNKSDIQTLVYKCTMANPDRFDKTLEKVLSSKRLINLGFSTAGRETFTTKENYQNDIKLLNISSELEGRRTLSIFKNDLIDVAKEKTLKAEQFRAIRHITDSGDISCLVGYAGSGKTYTMSALNEVYKRSGITVYGTSISGKAVHGLYNEASIESQTIAKMTKNYRLGKHQELPRKDSVLVVDEAGMVGLDDMLTLQKIAKERNLKLVLVGDPEQLESISKGNPFKAILEQVGFSVMKSITRQKDEKDQNATVWLGQGKTGLAIDHYADKGAIHIQNKADNYQAIIDRFDDYLDQGYELSDTLMLAFTRRDVALLNEKARSALIDRGMVKSGYNFGINLSGNDNKDRSLRVTDKKHFSAGDRIIFLKGATFDDGQEVKNSLFGKIKDIKDNTVTVITDEDRPRVISFDVTKYNHFDYGYAATVHKSQGATVKNVINYVSSNNWNSHLTYVAMTRHKFNMDVYVDDNVYRNIEELRKGLSSKSSKEFNSLDFVEKRQSNRIMDTLRRYMGYEVPEYQIKTTSNSEFAIVAELADLNREVGRDYYKLLGDDKELSDDSRELLQNKWAYRDKLAFMVSLDIEKYENALELNALDSVDILKWSENHLASIQFDRFVATDNLLYKGKVVEGIADTQRGRLLLSQNNLWDVHNKALSAYKLHKLDAPKEDIQFVEKYLSSRDIAYKYYKKSQGEVFNDRDIELFKDTVFAKTVKQSELTSAEYIRLSNKINKEGDSLAYKISKNLDAYKPIIEAKYTGKMLDSVYEAIARQARYQECREDVASYIGSEGLAREELAYRIYSNGKEYARFVAETGVNWKDINNYSRRKVLEVFRDNLDEGVRPIFDSIQRYKDSQYEVAEIMSELSNGNKKANILENVDDEKKQRLFKTIAERNEKAYELFDSVLSDKRDQELLDKLHPSFNLEKAEKHEALHIERLEAEARVEQYSGLLANKDNNLEQLKDIATTMTGRWGKHVFHLKRNNLNTNEVFSYADQRKYDLENDKLTGIDKEIHRSIADYILAKNNAAVAWADIRLGRGDKEKAQELGNIRNLRAYEVSKLIGSNPTSAMYRMFTENTDENKPENTNEKKVRLKDLVKSATEHELAIKLNDYTKLNPNSEEAIKFAKEISIKYPQKGFIYYGLERFGIDKKRFYTNIKIFDKNNLEFKQAKVHLELYKEASNKGITEWQGKLASEILANRANLKYLGDVDYNAINIQSLEYRLANYKASKDARIIEKFDFEKINSRFKQDINNYQHIFGSKTKETAKIISFGNYNVSKESGKWFDENQNVYREPVDAMLKVHGARFNGENYAEYVGRIAGLDKSELRFKEVVDPVKNQLQNDLADFKEKVQKKKAVQMLWENSKPLAGTIADRYLKEHRGIEDTSNLAMRYVPKGTDIMLSSGKIKPTHAPMLLVGGYNDKGDIVSAQRVYLDEKTTNKNTQMDNAKLSMGLVSGSGGLVQKGTSDRVYIVEGPETGASIALADKDASVYCSFGLGNLSKLDKLIKANEFKEVILAADNDGAGSNAEKLTKEATDRLHKQGIDVKVIEPAPIEGLAKTDWNDVLKSQGVQQIQSQLGIKVEYSKEHEKAKSLLDKIQEANQKIEKLSKKAKVYDNDVVFRYLSDEDKRDVKFAAGAVTEYQRQRDKLLKEFSVSQHKMPDSIKQTQEFKQTRQQSFDYQKEQQRLQSRQKSRSRDFDFY